MCQRRHFLTLFKPGRDLVDSMIRTMTLVPIHLNNAPIEEAMIAFDFSSQSADPQSIKEVFFRKIQGSYPTQTPINEAQIQFEEAGSKGTTRVAGYRTVSADGKQVCTILNNSFICSRLRPYETWESLRDEFAKLWNVYSSLDKVTVSKVSVRYINKFPVPISSELYEWVNTFPKIADGLPQDTTNVWVRLEMPITDPKGLLIVTEAQLPTEKTGFIPLVLDHDLQFPMNANTLNEWEILERARVLKNKYFFASVQPKLLKEFK